jgi:uncharacterized coiled-coil DUF342 family protein
MSVSLDYAVQFFGQAHAEALAIQEEQKKLGEAKSRLGTLEQEIQEKVNRSIALDRSLAQINAQIDAAKQELVDTQRAVEATRTERGHEESRLREIKAQIASLEERFVRK